MTYSAWHRVDGEPGSPPQSIPFPPVATEPAPVAIAVNVAVRGLNMATTSMVPPSSVLIVHVD
jgi:hypothetical protein